MADNGEYTPKIAVIGTEGSGKSVFAAVLAHKYGLNSGEQIRLDPTTRATQKFVRESFDILNGTHGTPRWLASTDPGTLFEFEWWVYVGSERKFTLRLVDAAGQDFRLLFGEEAIRNRESLTPVQTRLVEYASDADIIIVTVNLADFTGEPDPERRESSEWTLKFATDYLTHHGRQPKRMFLLFTQKDRFMHYKQALGDWARVAEKYLPLTAGNMTVGAVAAVAETMLDPAGQAGTVPKPGFASSGLSEIMSWISGQAQTVTDAETRRVADVQRFKRDAELQRFYRRGGLALGLGFCTAVLVLFLANQFWFSVFSSWTSLRESRTEDIVGSFTEYRPNPKPYIFRPYPPIPTEVERKTGERIIYGGLTPRGRFLIDIFSFVAAISVAVPVGWRMYRNPPHPVNTWIDGNP